MFWVLSPSGLNIVSPGASVARFGRRETEGLLGLAVDWSRIDWLPEVVHVEITTACDLACAGCYVRHAGGRPRDMPFALFRRIVAQLRELPLLNVTFGGGEPTLHRQFAALARCASRAGLALALTTNGLHMGKVDLRVFRQVNMSYHGSLPVLERALRQLRASGVARGINFVVRRPDLPALPAVAGLAGRYDAELLLLSYKPVAGDRENRVPAAQIQALAVFLHRRGLRVAMDGLACAGLAPEFCLQKKRFCAVDVDGNVLPCSFVRAPLGSLASGVFLDVWRRRGPQVPCPYFGGDGAPREGRAVDG